MARFPTMGFLGLLVGLLLLPLVWTLAGRPGLAWMETATVTLLGALVGAAELTSRYRGSEPLKLLQRPSALLYIALNGALAALALQGVYQSPTLYESIRTPDLWNRGQIDVRLVLTVGLGAMALFRSSLFTLRVGDDDVPIGPGTVMKMAMDAVDRQVDRDEGHGRSESLPDLDLDGLSFELAAKALPAFCVALMQNVPKEEVDALTARVKVLHENPDLSSGVKLRVLCCHLLNLVGPRVLKSALVVLKSDLQTEKPVLQSMSSTIGGPGERVTLTGRALGAPSETRSLLFNGVPIPAADVTVRAPDVWEFSIPAEAPGGGAWRDQQALFVAVRTSAPGEPVHQSNALKYTVLPSMSPGP